MDSKVKKAERIFLEIAKEPLTVEDIKGTLYAFGSELATLRLLKSYRESKNAKAGYSANRETFYFALEPKF